MGKPVISVIMATYNHAPFVGEAVSSVLEQTFANFEFLILDDGSTDSTPDRVRAFSDPRIRFTAWPRNRGACAAINTLLDACRGEYICLLNSDDRFLPNKLERQMLFLRSHPELSFCFTWAELIDDFGRPYVDDRHFYYGLFDQLPRTRQAWLRRFFWEGNCLCHPTIMARRKDYTLRFDERLCKLPDLHMWVRLARRYELGMLPERLTQFRILPGERNASGKKADTLALIQLELPLILEEYLSLSEEDCRAVFGLTGDPIARAFAAYRAALSLSPAAQSWGFSGLYRLLGDPRSREALAKLGFDQTTLFQLGGQSDVYSVLPHRGHAVLRGPGYSASCALPARRLLRGEDVFPARRVPRGLFPHLSIGAARRRPALRSLRVALPGAAHPGRPAPLPWTPTQSASHPEAQRSGGEGRHPFRPL